MCKTCKSYLPKKSFTKRTVCLCVIIQQSKVPTWRQCAVIQNMNTIHHVTHVTCWLRIREKAKCCPLFTHTKLRNWYLAIDILAIILNHHVVGLSIQPAGLFKCTVTTTGLILNNVWLNGIWARSRSWDKSWKCYCTTNNNSVSRMEVAALC